MQIASALHWTLLAALLVAPACTDSPPPAPVTTLSQYQQVGEYVREIFQDRDGNLWFSTSDGVCRYDGRSLTYLRDPEESGWSVQEILQDEDGTLWFAVVPGIRRYENGEFTDYTVADGLSHRRVLSMMLDSAGTLWAGTQGGVCRFDGESFVPFPIPRAEVENPGSNLSPLLAWGMAEDQDGNLWFGMDGEGVRKFDGESFTTYTTTDGLASNNVRSVYADRRGRVWIGTSLMPRLDPHHDPIRPRIGRRHSQVRIRTGLLRRT